MDIAEAIARVERVLRVNQVYAEPVTVDGVTVITAARVGGGGGGGMGRDSDVDAHHTAEEQTGSEGGGGGLGWTARPAGAFVFSGGTVRWEPAVDLNRLMTVVGVVAVAAMLTARAIVKAQARATR